MVQLSMRVAAAYLRLTQKRKFSTPERTRRLMTDPAVQTSPPRRLLRRHQVSSRTLGEFVCWTVTPRGAASGAVVYLHGGTYIAPMSPRQWDLVSRLAAAGLRVEVPMYGLAPQYTYRDAYPFLRQVVAELQADVDPARISLAGDSAGGGLALGLAQDLRDGGSPSPGRLVLIAPWLDLTLEGAGVEQAQARDPWLSRAGLVEAGRAWAGGDDARDPRLSPIFGDLAGLPPTDVYIGDRDLLHPDVRRLADLAADAAWSLDVVECPGAVHVYPLVPAPEGRQARDRIVARLAGRDAS